MSDDLGAIVSPSQKPTLGDRMRAIAQELRQEDAVQIKATSRILSAAAKLAENQDRLIDEVVEMVEDDLNRANQISESQSYTVDQLKQQFKSLTDAKAHFGLKASSWAALMTKLNEGSNSAKTTPSSQAKKASETRSQDRLEQRLTQIEHDIQHIRTDINQLVQLLEKILPKLM